MSATSPPNLQVVGPQEQAPQQTAPPQQQPEPQKDHIDPGPAEDRILSPEETINFFRTGSIEEPVEEEPPVTTPEQQEMAGEFFAQVPGESKPGQPAAQQPPAPTAQPSPEALQQAVAQDLQQGGPTPAPTVPQPGVQPPAQSPAGVVPAPTPSPQEAALQAQVQQLTGQVQALTAAMQQQAQQPPAPNAGQQAQQQQQPQFNFQVPAQYAEAIASDDPTLRVTAINQLLNGVAETVHAQTLKEVDQRLNTITPAIAQQVQTAQSQSDIKRDMYGTYPELSGMQDMVVAAASQLQAQFPGGWSPDYRDAIAERLSPLIQGLPQKVAAQRAARGIAPPAQQQFLPQGQPQQTLPPGVVPVQVQGGGHVAPAAQQPGQPVLVRDASGNYSQVYPQQVAAAGPQARPGVQGQVDPALQDIWSTFGYS